MNIYKTFLFTIATITVLGLGSCNEDEDALDGPCAELISSRYQDIEIARFVVNDTDSMFQNYGQQSYGPGESPSTFATLVSVSNESGTFARIKLQFTRISFDDSCIPTREHIVGIESNIDQLPFESKTYPINGTAASVIDNLNRGFASYSGSFLAEDEIVVLQILADGYLTISNYTPGERLTGKFEATIREGLTVGGRFDYDLTQKY